MVDSSLAKSINPWAAAARLVARWIDRHERIDELLETLPRSLTSAERARCQHLVYGVIRHFGRLESELRRLVSHPPRFATRAVLLIAGYELIEASHAPAEEGRAAKIVHHAVEQAKHLASPAEARLVNAVVRKLATALVAAKSPPRLASAEQLADYFSHPEWLVRRWLTQFGADPTRRLLEWNQQPAPVYARWRDSRATPPSWLTATAWDGFFEVPSGHWSEVEPLLSAGQLYLQDPGTRFSVELLAPQPGETVLDVCAAPGGKSLLIVDTLRRGTPDSTAAVGRVVAVDLPGKRLERLKENLSRAAGVDVALVQADVAKGAAKLLKEHGLPTEYAAVLIDVPCSNTGVMRHRIDVKWRLQEGDFRQHARQQLALLHATARLVAPGGRIVYSTCSIDSEENEDVVQAFLRDNVRFEREQHVVSFPWDAGHDGAAVFLLRKRP